MDIFILLGLEFLVHDLNDRTHKEMAELSYRQNKTEDSIESYKDWPQKCVH